MNLPLKTESKLQEIVHAWIREDAPLVIQMSIMPDHRDALIQRLRRYMEDELYKAYDDGFNDARETR